MAPQCTGIVRQLVCLGLALALASPCQAVKLFIIGDSLLDTGNSLKLAGYKKQPLAGWVPYGMSLPGKNVTGRFSDGKVFGDFFGERTDMQLALSRHSLVTTQISHNAA